MKTRTDPVARPSKPDKIALVLQGGGALGSYQAGVYDALAQAQYLPDWIAGISIGGINAALIAGNPPETRVAQLRKFWEQITRNATGWPTTGTDALASMRQMLHAQQALLFGQSGFFAPRKPFEWLSATRPVSYYDTSALKSTLEALVDFDRINSSSKHSSASGRSMRGPVALPTSTATA